MVLWSLTMTNAQHHLREQNAIANAGEQPFDKDGGEATGKIQDTFPPGAFSPVELL